MITCRELAELLFDFASGQLPPEHRGQVEQHLRLCPSCVAYVESYRLTIRMTRRLGRPPLPHRLTQRLRELLEGGRTAPGREGQGGPAPEEKGR